MKPKRKGRRVYEPTERDIRFACEKIQETWSSKERRKRAGSHVEPRWLPPLVEVDSLLNDPTCPSRDLSQM